jgi:hypothetical protein
MGNRLIKIAALLALCGALLVGCGAAPSSSPAASPLVAIPSGLEPRMTATEVGDLVRGWIHRDEILVGRALKPARIVSISASGGPTAGIEWVVHAEGTFVTNRTPPGGSPMMSGSIGFYRILDADGGIVDFGFER